MNNSRSSGIGNSIIVAGVLIAATVAGGFVWLDWRAEQRDRRAHSEAKAQQREETRRKNDAMAKLIKLYNHNMQRLEFEISQCESLLASAKYSDKTSGSGSETPSKEVRELEARLNDLREEKRVLRESFQEAWAKRATDED